MVSSWPQQRAQEVLRVCEANAQRLGVQPDRMEPPLLCLGLLRRRSQDKLIAVTLKVCLGACAHACMRGVHPWYVRTVQASVQV